MSFRAVWHWVRSRAYSRCLVQDDLGGNARVAFKLVCHPCQVLAAALGPGQLGEWFPCVGAERHPECFGSVPRPRGGQELDVSPTDGAAQRGMVRTRGKLDLAQLSATAKAGP